MIEDEWPAVNGKTTAELSLYLSVREVPGGDIAAVVTQYVDLFEHGWYKICPALVSKEVVGRVVEAVFIQAVSPPARKSLTLSTVIDP